MYIRLENLSKSYKNILAVNKLNLTINDGELVSLLGPSGCGKSTTLSMIAGLEKATEGNIYFDEENVSDVEPEKRGIGMVFQSYALYPHMTVMENIMFPLKMMKRNKKNSRNKVIEVAKTLHLDDYMDRKPGELSGGQQQRVAIARAIIKEPKILLLDEPLSNLDARLRIELREEIRKLQRKLNITTIFVTHDQEEAMSISDKIILMSEGICQQYSNPKDMYMNPSNVFVAGFLGNPPMNFTKGVYDNLSGDVALNCQDAGEEQYRKIIISKDRIANIRDIASGSVVVGIRPEDLRVNNEAYDIVGEIVSVQTLGKEIYVKLKAFSEEVLAVLPWDSNYEMNDKIYLEINKIHVFEK